MTNQNLFVTAKPRQFSSDPTVAIDTLADAHQVLGNDVRDLLKDLGLMTHSRQDGWEPTTAAQRSGALPTSHVVVRSVIPFATERFGTPDWSADAIRKARATRLKKERELAIAQVRADRIAKVEAEREREETLSAMTGMGRVLTMIQEREKQIREEIGHNEKRWAEELENQHLEMMHMEREHSIDDSYPDFEEELSIGRFQFSLDEMTHAAIQFVKSGRAVPVLQEELVG